MRKIISILLILVIAFSNIAFAEESIDVPSISVSGASTMEYSGEDVTVSMLNEHKYVIEYTVSMTECTGYKVYSSDANVKVFTLNDSNVQELKGDLTTDTKVYIKSNKPGKSSVYFIGYREDMPVCSYTTDIECIYNDERENAFLRSLKVGGTEVEGYNKNIFEYTYNVQNISENIEITYEKEVDSDSVEIVQLKDKAVIFVSNMDKTKNSIYIINYKYDFISDISVTIGSQRETFKELDYEVKYNGEIINNIVSVAVPSEYGYVVNDNKIQLAKAGTYNIVFTVGGATKVIEITVTGEPMIDDTQHDITIANVSEFELGSIYNIRCDSSVFYNDTRISTTSENEAVARIVGNKLFIVGIGDANIKIEHPIHGTLYDEDITIKNPKSTQYEVLPKIDTMNMLTGEVKIIEYQLEDTYDREVKYTLESGESVKLVGNTLVATSVGKSSIKISSGNAERVLEINCMASGTVIPTDIQVENTSSGAVINKESILKVTLVPDGSTVNANDISITSDKEIVVRNIGNFMYGVTPKESGDIAIKVTVDKYSISKTITLSVESSGDVVNPDVPGTKVDVEKIVLEDTYISLEVGATKTIRVKNITPASATNKEVRYESMNTRYATIDKNGKVTGERAGTVKINVYSVSNPEVYATCTINVYDEDDRDDRDDKYRYPVDKVVIYREDNGKEVAIRNGKTDVMVSTEQQFVARIYPYNATNQEVRWYTSNSNIAEVDEDGMLTAYRMGEVELRVVTRDGNHRDSIKVEITEWMLKPTSIKIVNIDNSEVNTEVKTGDKLALKVNFEPLLTTERDVIWTITEGFNLFTLSKTGDVEFKEVGKATIKVYTKDYSTYTTLTFNITYSDDYWKDIGSTKNMSPRKAIEVKFSEALSISNIQNGNIFVATTRDGNTKAENVIMELVDGNRVLKVSSLSGEWEPEKTYYLLIKGASKSESGIQLIKNCRYTFETRKGRQSAK